MPLTRRAFAGVVATALLEAAEELPAPVQSELARLGISKERLPAWLRTLEAETERREREGEWDHTVFYLLQSRRFSGEPRIEPALSAREFVTAQQIPPAVMRRMRALVSAKGDGDGRLGDVQRLLRTAADPVAELGLQYRRAMQSLYEKEFGGGEASRFYETRGHSTDTQVAANYGVWTGLSVLRAIAPAFRADQVLLLGPGLDFAPRTSLYDDVPPQSFQPYLTADALLRTKLSARPKVHCWDINRRVIGFISDFPSSRRELRLYSVPGDAEYNTYFGEVGEAIGTGTAVAMKDGLLVRRVTVREEIARGVTAERVNVLTVDGAGSRDLAMATNVLLYFQGAELLIALAHLAQQLRPGGFLLCNDIRPEVERFLGISGLRPRQASILRIGGMLTDAFALFEKAGAS